MNDSFSGLLIVSLLATASCGVGGSSAVTCENRVAAVPKAFTIESNCVKAHTTSVMTGKFRYWEENVGPHVAKVSGLEADLTATNSEALFKTATVRCTDGTKTPSYFWDLEFPREAFPGVEDDNGAVERSSRCSVSETAIGTESTCKPFVRKRVNDDNGNVIVDSSSPLLIFEGDTASAARQCIVKITTKP